MLGSVFAKDTIHLYIHQLFAILFVISLGIGEVVSLAGIKLSYITTIVMILFFLFETRGSIKLPGKKKNIRTLILFFLVWLVYPLVQYFWVKDLNLWFSFYVSLIINLLIIVLLILYINTWDDWKVISRAFIAFLVIQLIVGCWEILTGNHLVLLEGERNLLYYISKPLSFFGNGNDNAVVVFFGLYNVLIYLFSEKKSIVTKFFLTLLCIAAVIEIVIIDARGATYSIFLLPLFAIYYQLKQSLEKRSKNLSQLFSIFVIIITGGFLLWVFLSHPIEYYLARFSGEGNYYSDLGRIRIITDSFNAFVESFFLGIGPGQSIVASHINLHNFYLEILFEYGILIGGFMILQIFKVSFRNYPGLTMFSKSLIRAFPFVMVLTGVSSSKTFIMRPTWVLITLLFALYYVYPHTDRE